MSLINLLPRPIGRALCCLVFAPLSPAVAQWTAVVVTPVGVTAAHGNCAAGSTQGGYAIVGGQYHAFAWQGTSASAVDLHPPSLQVSQVLGASPYTQVGYTYVGRPRAALWTGTAASRVDLNPPTSLSSAAYASTGVRHVGRMQVGIVDHACVWTGSSALATDLNPSVAASSYALAISGTSIVGYVNLSTPSASHAALWSGAATTFLDLNPAGAAGSYCYGVEGGQQVGYAHINGQQHAGLWTGTAASWVDLNPIGTTSRALAVFGGQQVGYVATSQFFRHAALWSGTAASYVDLHSFLPAGYYADSEARGIWHDGTTLRVFGWATNSNPAREEAVLWSLPAGANTVASNTNVGQSCASLSLMATTRPLLGTNWSFTVNAIPANTVFGMHIFGLSDPGLNLAAFGMPNCQQHASLDVVVGPWTPTTTFAYGLTLPAAPYLLGVAVHSQVITFGVPPVNALGAVTSDAVRGVLGDQ